MIRLYYLILEIQCFRLIFRRRQSVEFMPRRGTLADLLEDLLDPLTFFVGVGPKFDNDDDKNNNIIINNVRTQIRISGYLLIPKTSAM